MSATLFASPFASAAGQEEGTVLAPRFDDKGLVTAVVTDFTSGMLLMVAHMDREALDLSIATRTAHYFSRSRQSLWKKGETSGALQIIREIRVDCDQDAIWLRVDVARPEETCHTHRDTCFYRQVDDTGDGRSLVLAPGAPPQGQKVP
jgi:phosphoribosyl-AMP cyclohydrolase